MSLDALVDEIASLEPRRLVEGGAAGFHRERTARLLRSRLQAGAASPLTSPATGRARFNRVGTDEGMPPLHAVAFPTKNEEDRLGLVNCL